MTVTSPPITPQIPAPEVQDGAPAGGPRQRRRAGASMKDLVGPAVRSSLAKLDPRDVARNPVMFVVEVGSVVTTIAFIAALTGSGQSALFVGLVCGWLWFTVLFANFATAMAEGRGKAQADTLRKTKTETLANVEVDRVVTQEAGQRAAQGRRRGGLGGRDDPRRRRRHRGHRLGGRVGDHRRVGARDPRERRRPQRRHRRHACPLGPDQGPHHLRPRPDVPRPHDRARRGRRAPEDAQRDRPEHPARRPHDHLPHRGGHAEAVRRLQRRRRLRDGAHRSARLPHPDHHRRTALRHRHRRHGPPGAAQRARHVRPRSGGGRGRRHAAARQDRHHHARQPAGRGVRPHARLHRGGGRRRGATGVTRRRDARGSLHRRAGQGVRPARPSHRPGRGHLRRVHGADAHERHRPRRPLGAQGRRRRGDGVDPAAGGRGAARTRVYAGASLRSGRHPARRRPRRQSRRA